MTNGSMLGSFVACSSTCNMCWQSAASPVTRTPCFASIAAAAAAMRSDFPDENARRKEEKRAEFPAMTVFVDAVGRHRSLESYFMCSTREESYLQYCTCTRQNQSYRCATGDCRLSGGHASSVCLVAGITLLQIFQYSRPNASWNSLCTSPRTSAMYQYHERIRMIQ